MAIRLTRDERRELSAVTGFELLDQPPAWWNQAVSVGLGSLPSQRSDPLLMGAPVGRQPADIERTPTSSVDDEGLRQVSITDMEVDGQLVFNVFVSAAEFLRGAEVESALDERATAALQAASGVNSVIHVDREVWEVRGDPREAELEQVVSIALESILGEFADKIADL